MDGRLCCLDGLLGDFPAWIRMKPSTLRLTRLSSLTCLFGRPRGFGRSKTATGGRQISASQN